MQLLPVFMTFFSFYTDAVHILLLVDAPLVDECWTSGDNVWSDFPSQSPTSKPKPTIAGEPKRPMSGARMGNRHSFRRSSYREDMIDAESNRHVSNEPTFVSVSDSYSYTAHSAAPASAVEWSGAHVVCRVRAHPAPEAERVVFELSARWVSVAGAGASDADWFAKMGAAEKSEQRSDGRNKGSNGGGGTDEKATIGTGQLNLSLSAVGIDRSLAARGFRTSFTPVLLNVS